MESHPLGLSSIAQLFPEFLSDARVPRVEVICPQPRRAVKIPSAIDCVGGLGSKSKGPLPAHQGDYNLDILNIVFGKGDAEDDLDMSNQTGFFCGSPPVRTSNPLGWDALFAKENTSFTSSTNNIHETRTPTRVERSSHSRGSSFGAESDSRTEGFTRAIPRLRRVVSALA